MNIGLIGCGRVSRLHVAAVDAVPGTELVAVSDVSEDRAQQVAAASGATVCSVDNLLRVSDLVIVATPSGTHAKYGMLAADAGCHVLVEKPMDVSMAAARQLTVACHRAGVLLSVVSQHRFDVEVMSLKRRIESGRLSPIVMADARSWWSRDDAYYRSSWRGTKALDGGALMNQGVHVVDLLLWLLGPVVFAHAERATVLHDIETEDAVVAVLHFARGTLATLSVTTCSAPGVGESITLTGPMGTVSPVLERGSHGAQLQDVVDAIRTGRQPSVTGRDGLHALELIADCQATGERMFSELR